MDILALFSFLLIGMIAGLIAGLLGLSGGVVVVPSLFLVFSILDFPQTYLMHMAIGTSLSAMVLTGIASTWTHHHHKGVMWFIVLMMLPGILVGCLFGSFIAQFLSGMVLQLVFGFFICSLGAYMLLQRIKRPGKDTKRPENTLYSWIGVGIGTISSLLGIGGGVFSVPLLMSYHYSEQKAVGTSAAVGTIITFMAALAYLYFGISLVNRPFSLGFIYLPAFGAISIGTVIFAPIGAKMAHKMDGKKLRKIFAASLILIGIFMIFN